MTSKSSHSALKGSNGAMPPIFISNCLKEKYLLHFFVSYIFNPLHSSVNQELFKKHLFNQSIATMKNTDSVMHLSYINYCLKVEYSLRFFVSYVQPIMQQYELRDV